MPTITPTHKVTPQYKDAILSVLKEEGGEAATRFVAHKEECELPIAGDALVRWGILEANPFEEQRDAELKSQGIMDTAEDVNVDAPQEDANTEGNDSTPTDEGKTSEDGNDSVPTDESGETNSTEDSEKSEDPAEGVDPQ